MNIHVNDTASMIEFGSTLGSLLEGGAVIEMIGDVGAGKTTLAKGIALGLGVDEDVQSPSFTISRVYDARDQLRLAHYDFYRLNDAGIMNNELDESVHDDRVVTLIEWADVVQGVLPEDRLTITITPETETTRHLQISSNGPLSGKVLQQL